MPYQGMESNMTENTHLPSPLPADFEEAVALSWGWIEACQRLLEGSYTKADTAEGWTRLKAAKEVFEVLAANEPAAAFETLIRLYGDHWQAARWYRERDFLWCCEEGQGELGFEFLRHTEKGKCPDDGGPYGSGRARCPDGQEIGFEFDCCGWRFQTMEEDK